MSNIRHSNNEVHVVWSTEHIRLKESRTTITTPFIAFRINMSIATTYMTKQHTSYSIYTT